MRALVEELFALCRAVGAVGRKEPQAAALLLLREGPMEPATLATRLAASASGHLIEGLRRRGWVERERGEDERSHRVRLTPAGRAEAARLEARDLDALAARLETFPAARRDETRAALQLLRGVLEESAPAAEA